MKTKIFNAVCKTRYLALLVVLIFTCGNVWAEDVIDAITASDLTATSTTYTDFSGVSKSSDAVYAGNSAKEASGNIQLRSKNSNSGIVSTASGGTLKSVTITVGSGSNQVDVYGKNSAYSLASDLYSDGTKGELIGSTSSTGTITVPAGKSYTHVGIRSNSGALYLSRVEITWDDGSGGSTCATPTFSVAAGTYTSSQSVTLSCTTTGATIHYTTDGTTPTNSSPTYSSAITVDVTKTIKAIAIKDGMTNSEVASATYTIKCATPTFSPGAGTYGAAQSVSISTTYGTNIYYTTDGTTPSTSSTPYTSAISVSESQTIKAIAVKTGCSNSEVGEAAYTINIPYTVSFSTGTGNPQQADIPETVAGAGITLPDGPTPACSGDGWSFAGWGYESCDETSDEPYLYFPGNTYYPEDDETLYAVYVRDETPTTTYMLLSEGAQVAPDANYIITAFAVDKAIKSEVYKSYYIAATGVTVTEDATGYYINNPNSKLIWKMEKTGSTISLYNAADNNYLKIYETSGHHNLALDASKHTFTLSEVRNPGYASKFKMESTNDPGYYVLYSTGSTDFTATNHDDHEDTELYLYKQMNSGTYNSNPVCCDKNVTLAHNSPLNGKVTFSSAGPIETCDGTVNTTMTITPNTGYTLTAFNYSTGAGTVSPTSQSPGAPSTTANSATPQVITLTFEQKANGTCTANATFSAIEPTAWSWTYNSVAIPNPINLYIGQTAALVATYTPSGLLNSEKNYDITKSSGLTQVSKTYAEEHPTYTFRADAVMDDGTIVLTNHNHTSLTTTVHVHVNPLPKVSFIDIVHSYESADVVGTIEDNVLVADKTTPTYADYSSTGANDCETYHTHLVGWIEKTWADAHPNADKAAMEAADPGIYFASGASINVLTYNGKTFYAVWAKEVKEAE